MLEVGDPQDYIPMKYMSGMTSKSSIGAQAHDSHASCNCWPVHILLTTESSKPTVQTRASYFPRKTSGLRTKTSRGREQKTMENNHSWQFVQKPPSPRCKAVQKSSTVELKSGFPELLVTYQTAMVLKFSRTEC